MLLVKWAWEDGLRTGCVGAVFCCSWGNMLEFLTSAMVLIVAAYLILVRRSGARWLGMPVTALAALGNGLAVTAFYVAVAPLVPALESVWFIIHIVAAVTAGAAFNLGGLAAILYLVKGRAKAQGRADGHPAAAPSAQTIDRLSYRFHALAFPVLDIRGTADAVWAEYAWGRHWGLDPKETWALLTRIVYACYLHARSTARWRGGNAAGIAVLLLSTFWFNFVGQPTGLKPPLLRRSLIP